MATIPIVKKYVQNFKQPGIKCGESNKDVLKSKTFEPVHEKTKNLGFRPGLTETGLYSHRRWLEA